MAVLKKRARYFNKDDRWVSPRQLSTPVPQVRADENSFAAPEESQNRGRAASSEAHNYMIIKKFTMAEWRLKL
jgi:hypothetical protein